MEIVLLIIQLLPVLLKIFLPLIEKRFGEVQEGKISGDVAREMNIAEAKTQLTASPPIPEWLIRIGHEIAYAKYNYQHNIEAKTKAWDDTIKGFMKKIGLQPMPYTQEQGFMDLYTSRPDVKK